MKARWLTAVPAVAALLCACLMVYLIFEIDDTRRQLQSDGVGEFSFVQQTDHNFDALAQALIDYLYLKEGHHPQSPQREYIRRFDVLYGLFKHIGIAYAEQLRHVSSADRLFADANAFIDRYEPFMHDSISLDEQTLINMVDEARQISTRVYQLGTEMFERKAMTRDLIASRMDGLYEAFWVCSIMFVITLSLALLLFVGLSRRARLLSAAAEQSQQQLDSALDELTSGDLARKAQTRFVAAASHDLRQPLHALGLYLEAMKRHVVSQQGKDILENSYRSAEALNQLLNSMLDLSRLDAGVIEVDPKHLSLDDVFFRLEQTFAPNAQQRDLHLEMDAGGLFVYSDPVLLERVLTNLLSNALYYTESGSVSLMATRQANTVRISVVDTGCGIAQEEQESIFDEYYQLHNPERDRTKGLGIGLSIVRRLTPLLSATLELTSTPGEGSEFVLKIPAGDAAMAIEEPLKGKDTDERYLHGLSILVIDDESDVREGMATLLSQHHSAVVAVESADSALQHIVEHEWVPELIIADYRLRDEQTGVQAIESIREELNEDVPAMIITGDTSSARLREAIASGFTLLHKPVEAGQLLNAIESLIGERT